MGVTPKKSPVLRVTEGFTLIELIVAVGIIGILLPTVFNIFFTIIRQQLVLLSYQTIKAQGDSATSNITSLLQNRAAYVTDSTYTSTDVCPLSILPTPTQSPHLYLKDRNGKRIHIYATALIPTPVLGGDYIASDASNLDGSGGKSYNLTSDDVRLQNLFFTCSRASEFSLPVVTTSFTIAKSTVFKDISLPYSFSVKLRSY